MEQDLTKIVQKRFEDIKNQDETWFEFWSARDLMKPLWYKEWRKFSNVIEKAKISCQNNNRNIEDHFVPKDKMVNLGSWSQRNIEDFFLTRYACYLVALNGNSRIEEIALIQEYFATQTRKQEVQEQRIEDEKRLEARKKLKENERKIEETVYQRWIIQPVEFATFKNKWIEALYNLSVKSLKQKRWIQKNRALADFDTEVELRAKDFIYAITDHNIKQKNLNWKTSLENELVDNSKATRKTLIDRDIIPENLEKQEDLKLIEKRREKEKLLKNKEVKTLNTSD